MFSLFITLVSLILLCKVGFMSSPRLCLFALVHCPTTLPVSFGVYFLNSILGILFYPALRHGSVVVPKNPKASRLFRYQIKSDNWFIHPFSWIVSDTYITKQQY